MPLFIFLFGLFLYVYIEISLIVAVGASIGVLPLILLMIAISATGLWLIRIRGLVTILNIRKEIAQGKIPTQAVISSVFFAIAGVLLLIPGFLSDILAVLLLIPFTRILFQGFILKLLSNKFKFRYFGKRSSQSYYQQNETTFEAEFERKADEDKWVK
ncbi:FxsA family protein [Otariodibacter sp.]|uniref:FxsA family protein n=1 Tax=Otariodibacter sp. TaxID=3030919 RepID=UPI002616E468|nr:FxsA family protein [Otariodibacter sp.]